MQSHGSHHDSLCATLCHVLVYCLFGYRPVSRSAGDDNDQGGITLTMVGSDGRARNIRTNMATFLRYLQGENAKEAQKEREWCQGSVVRELDIPRELWNRLKISPLDKSKFHRVESAVEGYKRQNLPFRELLAILDGLKDNEVAIAFVACLPLQEFIRMAELKQKVETDGCNALHWAVCRGGSAILLQNVEDILAAWPEICQQAGKNGLPIHTASQLLSMDPNLPVLQRVIQAYPRGLEKPNERGWIPLQLAIAVPKPNLQVVSALVQAYPEAVGVQTRTGLTAFHIAALQPNQPLELFEVLLQHGLQVQEALKKKDEKGVTALHAALVKNSDNLDLIKRLLEIWPEGVKEVDYDCNTALCLVAIGAKANLECVKLIHQAWPEAIDHRNSFAYTPLHAAIKAGASQDIVAYLLDASPASPPVYVSTCPGGETLLNAIMMNPKVDVDMARRIYDGYPAAIRKRSGGNRTMSLLPLHTALLGGVSKEVVAFLLEQWRGAAREMGTCHFTALHFAVMARRKESKDTSTAGSIQEKEDANDEDSSSSESSLLENDPLVGSESSNSDGDGPVGGCDRESKSSPPSAANVEIVKLIHLAWPEAIQVRNAANGATPLIQALVSGAPADVVEYLLDEFPQALSIRAAGGVTVLHAAIMGNASVDIFRLLLSAQRSTSQEIWYPTEAGSTPLILALAGGASLDVVNFLLQRNPRAAHQKMPSGLRETPLQTALQARADAPVIQCLVNAWPAGKLERNREGSLPMLYAELYPADTRPIIKSILSGRRPQSSGVLA